MLLMSGSQSMHKKETRVPEIPAAIPERFLPAYRCIQCLEQEERYLAAFNFGSLARGEATSHSDVDVNVIVEEPLVVVHIIENKMAHDQVEVLLISRKWLAEIRHLVCNCAFWMLRICNLNQAGRNINSRDTCPAMGKNARKIAFTTSCI